MFVKLLFIVVAAAPRANAIIRFGCSQLVTERFDPLVTPGIVSAHVHQIVGGNAFNLTMDHALDIPSIASCTTCKFKEDKSNYWTAVLYFKHTNGSFIRVPQIPNHRTGETDGGMTVYYTQPGGQPVTAFPKGFRMITGDPRMRDGLPPDPAIVASWALSFRCWDSQDFYDPSNSFPPGGGQYDTVHLPKKKCSGGIRSNIIFPSCWNGKDIDPADHTSHMAYPSGTVKPNVGILGFTGMGCPASHPIRTPNVLYEISWDTAKFNDLWPSNGKQPFFLSMGDPTGYGQHGDYLFGWEGDSLQRAMNTCYDRFGYPEACTELTLQSDAEMNACKLDARVEESIGDGQYIKALPGCNPLDHGPGPVTTTVEGCTAVSTTISLQPTPAVN